VPPVVHACTPWQRCTSRQPERRAKGGEHICQPGRAGRGSYQISTWLQYVRGPVCTCSMRSWLHHMPTFQEHSALCWLVRLVDLYCNAFTRKRTAAVPVSEHQFLL